MLKGLQLSYRVILMMLLIRTLRESGTKTVKRVMRRCSFYFLSRAFLNLFVLICRYLQNANCANLFHHLITNVILQDEDFVIDKDDGGSPTDDSGGEDSDASESGGESEVKCLSLFVYIPT